MRETVTTPFDGRVALTEWRFRRSVAPGAVNPSGPATLTQTNGWGILHLREKGVVVPTGQTWTPEKHSSLLPG